MFEERKQEGEWISSEKRGNRKIESVQCKLLDFMEVIISKDILRTLICVIDYEKYEYEPQIL